MLLSASSDLIGQTLSAESTFPKSLVGVTGESSFLSAFVPSLLDRKPVTDSRSQEGFHQRLSYTRRADGT